MRRDRFEVLSGIVARMAASDAAAAFELAGEFRGPLAAEMRRHLAAAGLPRPAPEDVDALVLDACLVLLHLAPGWRADVGAPPWRWAETALRNLAHAYSGHLRVELTDDHVDTATAGPSRELEPLTLLALLAERDPSCTLVRDALEQVGSPRDRAIVLELALQRRLGDPSPAVTVGRLHGLRPDAVRQVQARVTRRLRALAAADPKFAPIADLALIA